ncbi:PLP-dependent aminotransferase NCgl2355 [Vibrio ishigakensis]|nr:PLP-dependent aminotransferase NCgl2355 [Vibrio ishigakensis]
MEEEGIVRYADEVGNTVLGPALIELMEKHTSIGDIRGKGMFWALELVEDRATREPLSAQKMGALKAKLTDKGLLSFIVNNRIHVAPPLIIKPNEIEQGVAIISQVLSEFDH